MDSKKWYQSKTVWTAIAAIVGTVAAYFTGEMELQPTILAVVGSLMAIFIREGVGTQIK